MNKRLAFSLSLTVVLFLYTSCPAATLYVDDALGLDSNPGTFEFPKQTIINTIAAAKDYDTIILMDGTYQGSLNRNISFSGKVITLISNDGPDNCIIDAEDASRVFYIVGEDPDLVIEGFTITGGIYTDLNGGGGMFISNSNIMVKDCVFTGNTGYHKGGGLAASACAPTIENCIFENNIGGQTSGGGHGGAISIISSPAPGAMIKDCIIRNNVCSGVGGGVFNDNGQLTIIDSQIYGNRADNPTLACHGGGMYLEDGTQVDIINTDIVDNYARYHSGGVQASRNQVVNFTNVLFEHNTTNIGSGGAYFHSASLPSTTLVVRSYFDNCTFVSNSAAGNGGSMQISSVYSGAAEVNVTNSIFYDNTAGGNGPEINTDMRIIFNYSYSNIDPADIVMSGQINDLGGNFTIDPLFALEGYDDLGTWVTGDYHLKSQIGRWDDVSKTWVTDAVDSPCIDMGDPNDAYDLEPGYNGHRRNVGRFGQTAQASQSPICINPTLSADLTGDCRVDIGDFAEFAAQWLMCSFEPVEFCQ